MNRRQLPPRSLSWLFLLLLTSSLQAAEGITAAPAAEAEQIRHPALFLVGDSILKTGTGNGESGPWGWGSEIGAMFRQEKIHVYNRGLGGRSSRGYIEEGAWEKLLQQLQPGDYVIVQFGHNDAANSANYPDRATINSGGDETVQVGVGDAHRIIRSYGAYLRQIATDTRAKGATAIICSPVPRNQWEGGKIRRGFDGYAKWAADAAQASGALFIDLNGIVADRYDSLGQEKTRSLFNDTQHTNKLGARLNAESVVAGLRSLAALPLTSALATEAR